MALPKLTDLLRAEVVKRFALWYSSKEILAWLKEEHGITVGAPALTPYNFDNPKSRKTGTKKWVALFDETREQAKVDPADIPTSNKLVRMRIRDRLIMQLARAERVNAPLVNELLESQAKEDGGMFTNVRVLQHNARGALAQLLGCDPSELPDADP